MSNPLFILFLVLNYKISKSILASKLSHWFRLKPCRHLISLEAQSFSYSITVDVNQWTISLDTLVAISWQTYPGSSSYCVLHGSSIPLLLHAVKKDITSEMTDRLFDISIHIKIIKVCCYYFLMMVNCYYLKGCAVRWGKVDLSIIFQAIVFGRPEHCYFLFQYMEVYLIWDVGLSMSLCLEILSLHCYFLLQV